MNVDVEIYMNNFRSFFEKNPEQLKQLIGKIDSEKFFFGVKQIVEENAKDEEKALEPTRNQLIKLILDLNGETKNVEKVLPYMQHHMGLICLN
jgi:hypothetical protein